MRVSVDDLRGQLAPGPLAVDIPALEDTACQRTALKSFLETLLQERRTLDLQFLPGLCLETTDYFVQ